MGIIVSFLVAAAGVMTIRKGLLRGPLPPVALAAAIIAIFLAVLWSGTDLQSFAADMAASVIAGLLLILIYYFIERRR